MIIRKSGVHTDIFSILGLIGGLALFLYGMELMDDTLKKPRGWRCMRSIKKSIILPDFERVTNYV